MRKIKRASIPGAGCEAAVAIGKDGEDIQALAMPPEHGTGRFVQRLRREKLAVAAFIFLSLILMFITLGPVLLPHEVTAQALSRALEGPSADHWLGTDNLGRDMFVRLADGGRLSLLAATWSVITALILGVPLGLISGYSGGRLDSALMRLNDTLMSFPPLILAIAIAGFLGPNLRNAMIAIGVVFAPRFARLIRGVVMGAREETYVEAARALGVSRSRLVIRHILPNILSPVVVQITITIGLAILAEASLSFIGLGVQPPRSSWGGLLGTQIRFLYQAPLNVLSPGLFILTTVLAFQLLGDGLRDALGREVRNGRAV